MSRGVHPCTVLLGCGLGEEQQPDEEGWIPANLNLSSEHASQFEQLFNTVQYSQTPCRCVQHCRTAGVFVVPMYDNGSIFPVLPARSFIP
jgi:hypothetical protein